jgi:hypothetical protein
VVDKRNFLRFQLQVGPELWKHVRIMADESERWDRVRQDSGSREPFQSKASPVALHADANRRRNLDKEEAARDRVIFRWVLLVAGLAFFMVVLFFIVTRLAH